MADSQTTTEVQDSQVSTPLDDSSLSYFVTKLSSAYAKDLLSDDFWNTLFAGGLNLIGNPTDAFKYGYSTKYMSGETAGVPLADFTALKSFLKADINALQGANSKPTVNTYRYISLATLLAFINNSCILYDKSNNDSKPAIYLDFNQNANFCLRMPQQFSIDPGVCVVQTDCTDEQYNKLFTIKGIDITKITTPSSPVNGKLSKSLKDSSAVYIDSTNPARGKFMNVLVNTECIKATVAENTDDDKNIFLSRFLSSLMKKIQVALGNINNFEVGYDETANTVYIYDAQLVDLDKKTQPIPTLPVFGLTSTVRDFNLKSEASTRLGSMMAITARAGARNTGTNKDSAAFTALNQGLEDRLFVNTSTDPRKESNSAPPTGSTAGLETLGNTFNTQIGKLYEITTQNISYDVAAVESSKNYYTDAMLLLKGESPSGKIDSVAATGILPLALNMTLDGIGGVPLLQAFTIPANRLPAQYVKDGKPRVGFTIAGVSHTIDNNQWTTQIRGLMINIPEERRVTTPGYVASTNTTANQSPIPQTNTPQTVGCSSPAAIKKRGLIPVGKQLNTFDQVFEAVVKNIEGGYYHPDMQAANPVKFAAMLKSGETMYGIDRKGGAPSTSTCAACTNAQKTGFWDVIATEKANNPTTWKYSYLPPMGTPVQKQLYSLAKQIIEPIYTRGYTAAVKDPNLRSIIESDGRLWFHYVDAFGWNGGGWARGFHKVVENAYNAGERDPLKLANILIAEKKNGGYNAYKFGTGTDLGAKSALLITRRGNKYEQFIEC